MRSFKQLLTIGSTSLVLGAAALLVSGTVEFAVGGPNSKVARDDGTTNPPSVHQDLSTVAGPAGFFNHSSGFESTEPAPFALGAINGQPVTQADPTLKWGKSGANLSILQASVSDLHPATGAQHFRIAYDPARPSGAGFTTVTDGRMMSNATAGANPTPGLGIYTFDMDYAITNIASDFRVIAQNFNGPPFRAWQLSFDSGNFSSGEVFHSFGNFTNTTYGPFTPSLFYDDFGNYHHFRVVYDMCNQFQNGGVKTTYFHDGSEVGSYTEPASTDWANGYNQIIVLSNNVNHPNGNFWDMDNMSVAYQPCPPAVCGNGTPEAGETCGEPQLPGCHPGHTCDANTCTCNSICTLAEPCILENGPNGPFYPPFDALYGGIFLYNAGTIESVLVDTCGTPDVGGNDSRIFFWGSAGDGVCSITGVPCGSGCPSGETCLYDPGNNNDDCGSDPQFGPGSSTNASCYDAPGGGASPPWNSCTCYDIPEEYDPLFLLQTREAGPGGLIVNITKKAVCDGDILGSCCDTNGAGAGDCVDDVLQSSCTGPGQSFSTAKCASLTCACIPDCTGRVCGDDGCGGSCGTCDDGNRCNGDETCDQSGQCVPGTPVVCDDGNVCNGLETCNPADGSCVAGTPLTCDDGNVCNGVETCDPQSGCVAGTPLVCNDNNACNGVETCNPSSGCVPGTPPVCDNGQFCDGVETCNPSSGCVAGTAPNCDDGRDCSVDSCDEVNDVCVNDDADCAIPTVSEWGLVILALLLLTGAKVYFGRRQAIA